MKEFIRNRLIKLSTLSLGIILLAFSLFSMRLEAGELHAIIVGDTSFTGFWGFSKEGIDVRSIQQEIHHISFQTGLLLKETVIVGNEMTSSHLLLELNKLEVAEDDVIFFYYTGDGERTSTKESPLPNLIFIDGKSIDFASIKEILMQKKPRLLIAFAEAANKLVSPEAAKPLAEVKIPTIKKDQFSDSQAFDTPDVYVELFLNTSGWVIASAAKPGSYAVSGEEGGLFTRSFVNQLKYAASKNEKMSWHSLFERMTWDMNQGRFPSHPFYSIETTTPILE